MFYIFIKFQKHFVTKIIDSSVYKYKCLKITTRNIFFTCTKSIDLLLVPYLKTDHKLTYTVKFKVFKIMNMKLIFATDWKI